MGKGALATGGSALFSRPPSKRKPPTRLLVVVLFLLLLACGTTSTPATPPPTASAAAPAEALRTADTFLSSWCRQGYPHMYQLLTPSAQQRTPEPLFTDLHTDFAATGAVIRCNFERQAARIYGESVEVGYQLQLETQVFGTIQLENSLRLIEEGGRWGVDWTPQTLVVGLAPEGRLTTITAPAPRGRIFDAQGNVLAENEPLLIVGAIPGNIPDLATFAAQFSALTQVPAQTISETLSTAPPDWFIPLLELPATEGETLQPQLAALAGVRFRERSRRHYPQGTSMAHIVGYVGEITAEQLALPAYADYAPGAVIGQTGVEAWAEPYLAGPAQAQWVVLSPEGTLSRVIATQELSGSSDVTLTVDLEFQQAVEAILGERPGAIVALEPQTGYIRALAAYPAFDPNRLLHDAAYRGALLADPAAPLLNRATQAALPPGSVFKIVTMAAGLHSGLYTPESTYTCTGAWTGLGPGVVMHDWLRTGHGALTLHQALVQSCNPTFWNMGLTLNAQEPTYLPGIARQVGFGQSAGLRGGADAAGLIPDPAWKAAALGESWWAGDAVNMATGQGNVLATPLQVADMLAVVANSGALYRPTLVERMGETPLAPELLLQAPLAPETLAAIHTALVEVTSGPTGTARRAFEGFPLAVAGKTGTAENPGSAPHAWFAAYTPAENPQLVVVVMLENGGEGSTHAAPLARDVFAAYFGVGP